MAGYIIDGHAHACGEYVSGERIEKKLKAAGVDSVLLSPGEYMSKTTYALKNVAKRFPLGDVISKNNKKTALLILLTGMNRKIPAGNEYVYSLKQKYPELVKQCYWVISNNLAELEDDYEYMKFDMVKVHQCWEKFDIDSDFFEETAEFAEKKGLPLFIHAKSNAEIDKLIEYIKAHPALKLVVGHLYGLEHFMEHDKSYFKNTYFDLSNVNFVSKERTKMAYEHFGADHLLLGSDTPYGRHALEQTIEQIRELGLTEEETDQILGLNLLKLLEK